MLKRSMPALLTAALLAALMLALGACGEPETASGGMLSMDEIGTLESLYLTDRETALEGLGLSKKDLDGGDWSATSAGAYPLKRGRSIGGRIYRQIMLTSIGSPEGLYGMHFQASFDTQEEAEAAREALIDAATELYGEPVYPGTERWIAGKLTELSLHNVSFDSKTQLYTLSVEYSLPSVVEGRRLSGEEMEEMVRRAQGKAASGLLTGDEIEKYESSYLKSSDTFLEILGLTEDDLEGPEKASSGFWDLKEPRSIEDREFTQTLILSEAEPTGLTGMAFGRRLNGDEERRPLLKAIYEQAVSLYGEPSTGPDQESRIPKQLEKELPGGCFETWEVGGMTTLTLKLFIPSELGPLVDGVPAIGIEYRMKAAE